jgi:hypothetical protein
MHKYCNPLKKSILANKSSTELNLILRNIKLGKKHLEQNLNKTQLNELVNAGKEKIKDPRFKADLEEKSGSFLRIFITIVTSFLGIWTGLMDFLSNGQSSHLQFYSVFFITLIMGIVFGLFSYRYVVGKAKEARIQENLINLQIRIIGLMTRKKYRLAKKFEEKLARQLKELNMDEADLTIARLFWSEQATRSSMKHIVDRLHNVITKVKKETALLYLGYAITQITKILQKEVTLGECRQQSTINDKSDMMAVLTKAISTAPKPSLRLSVWLASNLRTFIIGIIPFLLGTFGASFIFLNTMPNLLKTLGLVNPSPFISSPVFKYLMLGIAILFILYLGISQFREFYRSYLRSKIVERSQIELIEKELKYFILAKHVSHLGSFFHFMRGIVEYIKLAVKP